jgi:hypothetical protein
MKEIAFFGKFRRLPTKKKGSRLHRIPLICFQFYPYGNFSIQFPLLFSIWFDISGTHFRSSSIYGSWNDNPAILWFSWCRQNHKNLSLVLKAVGCSLRQNPVTWKKNSSEGNIIVGREISFVGREISCRQGNSRIYFPAILCSYT